MKSYGTFIQPEMIRFERLLPGPIERVWAYLTEADKRGEWLAGGEMELKVGGTVKLHFKHDNLTPHKETVPDKYKEFGDESFMTGRITRLDPPRLLSYTWGEENMDDSEVTFELTPKGDNVLLELTHRRIGDNRDMLLGISAGWHTHIDILVDKLNNRTPKPFWDAHMQLEEEYKKKLDAFYAQRR